MGSRSNAPPKKPIMAPPGPPRRSQSSITSSQPAPTMLPKPNVKYSSAPRVRRRLVGGNSKLFLQRGEELLGAQLTGRAGWRSEEHTSELQSRENLVCRLLLEKKKKLY